MEQQENLPQKSGFNKIVTDIYSFVKKRRAATVITAVAAALCITVTAVYYSANSDAPQTVSSLPSETESDIQSNNVSTAIFESDEAARKKKGVFESPSAEKIPVAML